MPLKEGTFSFSAFSLLYQLVQSFLSSYIIKCWTFKLGDEIKTKCQEVLLPGKHFHNAVGTLVSLDNKKVCELEKSLYHKDHKTSPGSQNKDSYHLHIHLKSTHIHENVGCPPQSNLW